MREAVHLRPNVLAEPFVSYGLERMKDINSLIDKELRAQGEH